MDKRDSRTKMGFVKPQTKSGQQPSEDVGLGLNTSRTRPTLRLGLGNNGLGKIQCRPDESDALSKSKQTSPRSCNKKALFKPLTESTQKFCNDNDGNGDGIFATPLTPVRPPPLLSQSMDVVSMPNPEANSVALMGLISQHALDFDITPVKSSGRNSNTGLGGKRSVARNSNIKHDSQFITASQAMKTQVNVPKSAFLGMLSHNESIFGAVNLEEVEKIFYKNSSCGTNNNVKEQNVCSSVTTEEKTNQDDNSVVKKRKKVIPVSNTDDNASVVPVESESWQPTSSFFIGIDSSCTITQRISPSVVPMSEKIRRALKTNAEKPITPKLQNPPVARGNISPVSKSTLLELGPFFGLPSQVKSLIQQFKGIQELYTWQEECLHLPAIAERRNLIYALPTSGGKTLVAEILILRELLCHKKNVIFVLPYVSIVQEKVRALSAFAVALNFLVEEYAAGKGLYPPRKRRWKQSVFICTIEKAHGLINSLIELDRISEIGLVVVDELHLVGDMSGRGANLEGLLTKILFSPAQVQIVGMSATIGNLKEIADFLKAETYTQDFRPVELTEYIKLENCLYKVNQNIKEEEELVTLVKTLDYEYNEYMRRVDPDMLAGLVLEVIPTHSCLLFCASKQNCENVAILLSRLLPKDLLLEHKKAEKIALYNALLTQGNGSVCPVLAQTLPYGIAYHHSGLTGDERRLLEEAYLSSVVCCICCTSTLAAGVNLPAKRVIVRSPYVGRAFITLSRYKQMVGRAGRAGMGDSGESVLMCAKSDVDKVRNLLESNMDASQSGLHLDDSRGMRNLVLSAIGLGMATTRAAIHGLVECTLLHVQAASLDLDAVKLADQAVERLIKLGAVRTNDNACDVSILNSSLSIQIAGGTELNDQSAVQIEAEQSTDKKTVVVRNDSELTISKLGRAAMKGCIELSRARLLYEDLRQAQTSFVCLSFLHLLYLVTPYDLADQISIINDIYFRSLQDLDKKDVKTARILGLNEAAMTSLMKGKVIKGAEERVVKRFYVTLMLNDLWVQKSTWEVAEKYRVSRGFVQSLMTSSSAFASCVMRFCQELDEMWCFRDLLVSFTQRLAHCCSAELLPLMELPSVKRGRAKQLYNAGYRTIMDVAKANPTSLMQEIDPLPRKIAFQIVAAAKMHLVEKVETLREEAADAIEVLAMDNKIKFN